MFGRQRQRQLLLVEPRRLQQHPVGDREGGRRRQVHDRVERPHDHHRRRPTASRSRSTGGGSSPGSTAARSTTSSTTSGVVEPLYQVMTRDEETGDVVLKVVNARAREVRTDVRLGAGGARRHGHGHDDDGGRADRRELVRRARPRSAPVERSVSGLGSRFTYEFPAYSITFIRLHRAAPAAAGAAGGVPAGRRAGAACRSQDADRLDAPARGSQAPRAGEDRLRADRRRALPRDASARARQADRGRPVVQHPGEPDHHRRLRIGVRDYRRLSRRRSARVTVTLLTRGSDGELRRVTARLGLRR